MTSERVKAADYIVRRLVEVHGIRQAFLITGGGAMHLNDAFARQRGLDVLHPHHEQACAIAAEGYARVTGRPAVVNVTSGPGGTNTLTGVLGQWTDSVPAVYLSGQIKTETSLRSVAGSGLRQLGDQEVDIVRLVSPLVKFAATVERPDQARRLVDAAYRAAVGGRPGPVWLDVPLDVQAAWIDPDAMEPDLPEAPEPGDPADPAAAEAGADAFLDLLAASRRPLLLAGHGVRLAGARASLLSAAEALGIPLVASFNGCDLVPTAHPLYVGRVGTLGGRAGNFALQNADLLLCVGTRNNIRQVSYAWGLFARSAKKVVVDIDAAELRKPTVTPDLGLHLDAGAFLKALLRRAAARGVPDGRSEWRDWCAERRRRYPPTAGRVAGERLDPYLFVERLSQVLPEGAVVVCGDGTASVAPFQAAVVKEGQRYLWNSGCASMGWDLPAALGAATARGGEGVVCLAGDGSLMMNLQELATLAHRRLNVKLFVLNNGGYLSIRQTQGAYFEGRYFGIDAATGVGFPDFGALARAFGLPFERLARPAELDAGLARVLATQGPCVCEVLLPPDYAFEPKLASAKLPDGRMVSKPLEDLSPLLPREEFLENMIVPPLQD